MQRQASRRMRLLDEDRGSASLELTILFPVVLALLFTALQAGMWFYARAVAMSAAQEGVRNTRVVDGTAAAGEAAARQFGETTGKGVITITGVDVSDGDQVTVTVTGDALSLLPGLSFTVTQTASGPKEQVVTQ